MRSLLIGIFGVLVALSGCTTQKKVVKKHVVAEVLQNTLDTSRLFRQAHVGLLVTEGEDTIFSHQAHRYFLPASTTKLFTFYAGLISLPDSLPSVYSLQRSDTLFLWGTGDPTTLHPNFERQRTVEWLQKHPARTLVYSDAHFQSTGLGLGWAWDDFDADFSSETSAMPLYGNVVWARVKAGQLIVHPRFFHSSFDEIPSGRWIRRSWTDNRFTFPTSLRQSNAFEQEIPFRTSGTLTQQLWTDTLGRDVLYRPILLPTHYQTLYSSPADTVYRRMLWVSDNFLAEQLLLMCGPTWGKLGNTPAIIDALLKGPLRTLPDAPRWVDGSGLSRYNLQTPRNLVHLLGKLQEKLPLDSLFQFLPATHRAKESAATPFVFAKSGSMSGVYNLTGFFRSQTGKLYRFAFFTNQFTVPISRMRQEISLLLQKWYEADR